VPNKENEWKPRVQVDSRWHAESVEVQATPDNIQRLDDPLAGEAARLGALDE